MIGFRLAGILPCNEPSMIGSPTQDALSPSSFLNYLELQDPLLHLLHHGKSG